MYIVSYMQIMKSHFGMLAPDVEIDDGKGTILISSEEGETDGERNAVDILYTCTCIYM